MSTTQEHWPFFELCREPTYVFTGDQDWAPEWASEIQVRMHREADLPLHMFCTSPSDELAAADGDRLSVGIHPNFLPGSTHGASYDEVVDTCLTMYPQARTARCHAFTETSAAMKALAAAGIVADSNGCTMMQPWISPLVHFTGIVRIPVFLEDDVLMEGYTEIPRFENVVGALETPGLKIFNFHPSHVGLNSASFDDYVKHRSALTGGDSRPLRLTPYGTADFYQDLLDWVGERRDRVLSFPRLVEQVQAIATPGAR